MHEKFQPIVAVFAACVAAAGCSTPADNAPVANTAIPSDWSHYGEGRCDYLIAYRVEE